MCWLKNEEVALHLKGSSIIGVGPQDERIHRQLKDRILQLFQATVLGFRFRFLFWIFETISQTVEGQNPATAQHTFPLHPLI